MGDHTRQRKHYLTSSGEKTWPPDFIVSSFIYTNAHLNLTLILSIFVTEVNDLEVEVGNITKVSSQHKSLQKLCILMDISDWESWHTYFP